MFEKERAELTGSLRRKGIRDEAVLQAINTVPRHEFINKTLWHLAYADNPLPIGSQQTISQPYTVAFMTEKLGVKKGGKVLEIGTGSGYQAAILCVMGIKVYSVEREFDLYKETNRLLQHLGYSVATRYGDGTIGWNEFAPYDGIIVTAGAPSLPGTLKKQLKPGGKLVVPVGDRSSQKLFVVERVDETEFKETVIPGFKFVPLIGKEGWDN
ncbi:MAG: Protein-L-isoaspartate O-methyltransferase [Ignavibacteriaceae bacterium]|nr:Protein-L-isoaspartate O-methyltransferase [Ignavibacteriaceae bacterium]MCK6612728.1 protein-L-isoaspartate(D-aspartate) O-methyltransferase [Ignavibacteriaceae bacterium]